MLSLIAVENYRSLLNITVPLDQLNLITGANGSGKSNLYRALRLLAETAQGGVISALAREGGLHSTFWAGPETISRHMERGEVPVQGSVRTKSKRLNLGFSTGDLSYSISLGLPTPSTSAFALDPEIKREIIWAGETFRPNSCLVERTNSVVKVHSGKEWENVSETLNSFDSIFSQVGDPKSTPEIAALRELLRGWRFYDHFRTDHDAPARLPQLGTRTVALQHDGRDLAAALQTIFEIGDGDMVRTAVGEAFPGGEIFIRSHEDTRFTVQLKQPGLLRPLEGTELSEGTLRFILWVAALCTPRPPSLMVLNEPETSLHPELIPALANLIVAASKRSQVWVISHSEELAKCLRTHCGCRSIALVKELGQTKIQEYEEQSSWRFAD